MVVGSNSCLQMEKIGAHFTKCFFLLFGGKKTKGGRSQFPLTDEAKIPCGPEPESSSKREKMKELWSGKECSDIPKMH